MVDLKLNIEQKRALDALRSGRNVFLSGSAGTGKSTVLKEFLSTAGRNGSKVVVCAPTGIAAINVHGVTIHKVFKAKLEPFTNRPEAATKATDVIKAAEVVVIDEISMCRIDLFQFVGRVIQDENARRRKKGFAGKTIQLIVVGDFFQLPPVLKDKDKVVIDDVYGAGKKYAFQAPIWKEFSFAPVVLKEVVRQDNLEFVNHLNGIRTGRFVDCGWFERNTSPKPIKGAISLCPRNAEARAINQQKLDEIERRAFSYRAYVSGKVSSGEYPADESLVVKEGAHVIMLTNDSSDRWVNGTIATIARASETSVCVKLPNGVLAEVYRHKWEFEEYEVDKKTKRLKKVPVGSFTQYPFRLAYAITIHKSQGQTFDFANINPSAFDTGMLYVALSRVRTPQGIYLMDAMSQDAIKVDAAVVDFYRQLETDGEAPVASEKKEHPSFGLSTPSRPEATQEVKKGKSDFDREYESLCEQAENLWESDLRTAVKAARKRHPAWAFAKIQEECADEIKRKYIVRISEISKTLKSASSKTELAKMAKEAALLYQAYGEREKARKCLEKYIALNSLSCADKAKSNFCIGQTSRSAFADEAFKLSYASLSADASRIWENDLRSLTESQRNAGGQGSSRTNFELERFLRTKYLKEVDRLWNEFDTLTSKEHQTRSLRKIALLYQAAGDEGKAKACLKRHLSKV